MLKFEAIEDNAGGLYLVVFDNNGDAIYMHTEYEFNPGQLSEDIEALKRGDNPASDWDGNVESPEELYGEITSNINTYKIVCDNDGIYPNNMGAAARLEFGIHQE